MHTVQDVYAPPKSGPSRHARARRTVAHPRWSWPAWLLAALLVAACAEPPTKEMDQAQSAIDGARAAGAERYAADDYKAAVAALSESRAAVSGKDYRLALNHALDARDRAQTAARVAADTTAQMRADVERTLADIATPLANAHARLAAAEKHRAARRRLRAPSSALSAIDADVQEAGEALKVEDYAAAQAALRDVRTRISETIAQIEAIAAPATGRRRR